MNIRECIIETMRTLHHGMSQEDARRLLQYNIIFDPEIINKRNIQPKPGNAITMWQREVQYQMGFNNKSLEDVRKNLQTEAKKRLDPFSFTPFKR